MYCENIIKLYVHNATKENYEIASTLPLDKYTILKSFKASIGDKVVFSKVMEKEKAEEDGADYPCLIKSVGSPPTEYPVMDESVF